MNLSMHTLLIWYAKIKGWTSTNYLQKHSIIWRFYATT